MSAEETLKLKLLFSAEGLSDISREMTQLAGRAGGPTTRVKQSLMDLWSKGSETARGITPMKDAAGVGLGGMQSMMGLFGSGMTEALSKSTEKLAKNMGKSGEEMEKANKKKHKLDKNLKKTTETTDGFIKKIVEMGGRLRSTSRLFFYASMDLRQFADMILGPVMQGIRIWMDYEQSLAKVFVNVEALGGDGARAMAQLGEAITEMAKSWEFSEQSIAQAASVLGQARVPVDEIIESLDDLAGIARVNFVQIDQAAQMTLRIMRQFRMSLEDATTQMWRMTAISQHTGEAITTIVNAMGFATEMGQILGFTFAEIATNMTLLTEKYGSASIAGRRLSTVYSRLMQVGEEYGIQLRALDGAMLNNREQISNLADYLDLIGDPLEQNQYLIALFGRTAADAAKTLIEAFKTGKLDEVMADTGDNMIEAMKDVSESMEQLSYISIVDLTESLKDLQLAIGRELAPVLKQLSEDFIPLIASFAEFVAKNKEAVIAITALGVAMAGFSLVMMAAGFAIEIIVALATAIGAIVAAGEWLAGMFAAASFSGQGFASVLGGILAPLLLIVAAIIFISGIILGFIVPIQNLGKSLDKAGKEISLFGAIAKAVGGILKFIAGILKIIIGIVLSVAAAIFFMGLTIGAIIPGILEFFNLLKPLVAVLDHLGNVIEFVGNAIDDIGNKFMDLLGALLPHSPSLADRFVELGEAVNASLYPMQQATMWGRRLSHTMNNVKANANINLGGAIGEGMAAGMAGGQGGVPVIVNVDGAYVQDPEQLGMIIAERSVSEAKRAYRRGAY